MRVLSRRLSKRARDERRGTHVDGQQSRRNLHRLDRECRAACEACTARPVTF
jgi:hypothetical protein